MSHLVIFIERNAILINNEPISMAMADLKLPGDHLVSP
jgi:hypothetical protein